MPDVTLIMFSSIGMEIGQAGLSRPVAWPARAWFGLIKFRPGPGSSFFLGLFLKTGQAQAFKKSLFSLQAGLLRKKKKK